MCCRAVLTPSDPCFKAVMFGKRAPRRAVHMYCVEGKCYRGLRDLRGGMYALAGRGGECR